MTNNAKTGVIAVAIIGGLFLCGGGIVAGIVLVKGRDKATVDTGKAVGLGDEEAARKGREIAKGIPTEAREGDAWTLPDLAKFVDAKGAVKADEVSYATPFGMPLAEFVKDRNVVLNVIHCDNPKKAKDVAAARGKEAYFGWGRFAISGNKWAVDAVKKALGL